MYFAGAALAPTGCCDWPSCYDERTQLCLDTCLKTWSQVTIHFYTRVSPRVCCSAPPGCTSCPATPTSSPPSARCLSSATLTPPHTSRRQSRWVSPGPRERYPDYNEGSPYSDFQRKILVIVHNFIFCA